MKYLNKLIPRRLRQWFLWVVPLGVLLALLKLDPDGGLSLVVWIVSFTKAFLFVACAHLARRFLFDYPEADFQSLLSMAKNTPEGAGRAAIAIAIVFAALLMLFAGAAHAQDVRTFIPANARPLLPVVQAEKTRFWADHPAPQLLPALIEHESCVSLKSTRCWSAKSRLKTAREEGAGLGQITRAYRKDGTERFDALAEQVARHPALGGWNWSNVYDRPDLQIRSIILMGHDNYTFFMRFAPDPMARLAFADAAYNGGLNGVQAERQACQLSAPCNPKQWFGNVEAHCLKSTVALYGQRSACDINRHHVEDVVRVRSHKYVGLVV